MRASDMKQYIMELFGQDKLQAEGEFGFHVDDQREIQRLGYATNLTPETVDEAIRNEVDLVITHHDAWGFIYGMKDVCMEKLKHHGMSHFFFHLPLDDSDFGTNEAFLKKLNATVISKANLYSDHFYCGHVAELTTPVSFSELAAKVEEILGEKVRAWQNHERPVKRVGFVSGGGSMTNDIKEHVDAGCDVYITGEKSLYTIQYADFAKIDLIVGSHTFTEIYGVESLCELITARFPGIAKIQLAERHVE